MPLDRPDLLLLPDGTWTDRFGRPCPACGSAIFEVMRVQRGPREVVESRCPKCPLLTDRGVSSKILLGHHDLLAGTLILLATTPGANP